jgi:hypothetical protein
MPSGSQFRQGAQYLNDPLPNLPGATPPVPPVPTAFGASYVINLVSVTQVAGTDATALCAVPTVPLVTGTLVYFVNGGIAQMWQLQVWIAQAGTGTALPNDWSSLTNNRIWVQLQ